MKAIKQLYHEHKIITLILTSPIWLFVLFSVLFTANEIYKSTQEGVVTEVLNKTLPQHGYSDIYYLNQVKADSHFGMGTTYVSTKRTVKENQDLFAKAGKKIDKGDANLRIQKHIQCYSGE
ncbi:hypothetical protein [Lactobacillus delbrueckii]|uniref:hypothetical protein n=1 Tax=Lactobacillus delbrueckii TaxID=1584 RepID=UPI001E2E361E|nr:hypothetical protein [Lactobacillus delbrueckii]MCD5452111.1 hypothetical protein [Lactobacillus delbrueckii subsp. lactis]